jgi:hypothetical protein
MPAEDLFAEAMLAYDNEGRHSEGRHSEGKRT